MTTYYNNAILYYLRGGSTVMFSEASFVESIVEISCTLKCIK